MNASVNESRAGLARSGTGATGKNRRAFGKYLVGARSALRTSLAYKLDFLQPCVTYSLFVFIFTRLWSGVFASKGSIAGYDAHMAIWYFIVSEIAAFGGTGAFQELANEVKSGLIAYSLGRPYRFLGFQFAKCMGQTLPVTAAQMAIGTAMGLLATGHLPFAGPAGAAAVLVSLALSVCLNFFIQASLGFTAFWLEENAAAFWIWQKLCLIFGTLVPVEFYPEFLRRFIIWSPFSSVVWAPARLAVAGGPEREGFLATAAILGTQAGWLAAAIGLAAFIFSRGVRRVSIQGG